MMVGPNDSKEKGVRVLVRWHLLFGWSKYR